MSYANVAQDTEVSTPRRGRASQVITFSLIVVLMGLVGWLLYDVYQLKENVKVIESQVSAIESQVSATNSEVFAISSELSAVGALARNANMYAHSHYSDVRMKRNVADLDNALTNTLRLRAVTFDWNTDEFPAMGFSSQTQIGLIAQEVEQVYPELVSVDANGYEMIDYAGLTPILLEAIEEQQTVISEIQQQNAELVERITKLEHATGTSK